MTVILIDACNVMTGVFGGGNQPGSPKWDANDSAIGVPFITDDGRGARCIRIDGFSTNWYQAGMYKTFTSTDEIMLSAYMRFSRSDAVQPIWNFFASGAGGAQGRLWLNTVVTDKILRFTGPDPFSAGDVRATGSYVWQDNVWTHIEVYLKLRNDATGRFVVKLKPVGGAASTDIDFTGVTAGVGGVGALNWLGESGALVGTHDLADVIIRTGSTFYGVTRVRTLRPNGAGAHTELTPTPAVANFLTQADIPNDGDTTYAEGVAATKDLYTFSNLKSDDAPLMAELVLQAKSGSVAALAKTASEIQGTTQALTAAYKMYTERYETDPADASAWTKAKIDAAQFGVVAVT